MITVDSPYWDDTTLNSVAQSNVVNWVNIVALTPAFRLLYNLNCSSQCSILPFLWEDSLVAWLSDFNYVSFFRESIDLDLGDFILERQACTHARAALLSN